MNIIKNSISILIKIMQFNRDGRHEQLRLRSSSAITLAVVISNYACGRHDYLTPPFYSIPTASGIA